LFDAVLAEEYREPQQDSAIVVEDMRSSTSWRQRHHQARAAMRLNS